MHSLTETAIAEPTSLRAQAPPDKGQAIYVQGLQALRDGKADVAVSLLTQALRWQPTHFAMRRNLVRALLISEAFEQVVVQANAALSGMPDDAELHFARGTALMIVRQLLEFRIRTGCGSLLAGRRIEHPRVSALEVVHEVWVPGGWRGTPP